DDVLGGAAALVAFDGPPLTSANVVVIAGFAGVAWCALCPPTVMTRVLGAGLALALLGGLAQVLLAGHLATPEPGRPLLTRAGAMPLLVVPHRPGWNLVHVPDEPVLVGNAASALVPATSRPAASGRWALVWLEEGRGTLWLDHAGERRTVPVDTGRDPWTGPDVRGADGPEYASAVLGAVLTGRAEDVPWPGERLSDADAASVRELVRSLAGREVALATDTSARSTAAADVARREAAGVGVSITPHATETVVLTGWSAAAAHDGPAHLAPWLLTPDLLDRPTTRTVPLGHDPTTPAAQRYLAALADAFPGEAPSQPGLTAWLTGRGEPTDGPPTLLSDTRHWPTPTHTP
ncbi:DUF6239 family natural product biosynthesis protein, partial [Saccharothrix hoggarensis]